MAGPFTASFSIHTSTLYLPDIAIDRVHSNDNDAQGYTGARGGAQGRQQDV